MPKKSNQKNPGEISGKVPSQKREAKKELPPGEQLFRNLTERSLVGIYVVQDGMFKSANPNAAAYAGYTPKDLIGKRSDSIVHSEDKATHRKSALDMLKGKRTSPYEFRIIGKDGSIHWIMESVTPVVFEGRNAILGNSMDITEYKRAEEAMRESERRLADIIEFLPDATLAIDRQGKVIAWNQAIEEMTGVKASGMLGKGDYEYALPFYGRRRPILIDLVFGYTEEIEKQYHFIRKEGDVLLTEADVPLKGRPHVLWAKASPLYNAKGDIVGAIESIRDITERMHAEEKLRESEEKYRSLAVTVDLMYLVDRKCRYLSMNEGYLSRLGMPSDKIEGRFYEEFHSEEDTKEFSGLVDNILETGQSIQHEHRSERDGKYFLRTLSPVKDSEGRISAVTVVSKDITKRKQAEEGLRESERRLADIIEFLPDATLAIDRQGKVIAWNQAIEEMTGVKASDILGKGDYEYALPFYGVRRPILIDLVLKPDKKIEESYYSFLEKQKDLLIVETWVPFLKWKKAFLWAKASPLYDSKGEIVGAIESIRDITQRHQLEDLLRASEEKYRQLFTTVPDAIYIFDAETRQMIDANESVLQLYGYSRQEFLDLTHADITAEPEESEKAIQITISGKMHRVPLRYHRKKDNTVFPVEASTSMFDLGGRKVICVVIRDITDRKMAEEALEKRERELEAKTLELEDLNAALRVLLKQREEDKNELEQKVLSNVKTLILPHMEKLRNHVDMKGLSYVNVLESNLKDIISPFAQKLSVKYLNFTNREVQIANLIKEEKTTKEIAVLLNVSESAVNVYRYHIRRKLNLTKKHNLRASISTLV
ncbi:MAG: PAS domain S-box protein [Deltaproteobacteria bacterium]|nr:PAS domain S-box protein [Deltaproteobacteria bacterium]